MEQINYIELSQEQINMLPLMWESMEGIDLTDDLVKAGFLSVGAKEVVHIVNGRPAVWRIFGGHHVPIFLDKVAGTAISTLQGIVDKITPFSKGASEGKQIAHIIGDGFGFFKPRGALSGLGGEPTINEIAAFRIAKALGEDFVPPITIRNIGGVEGTFSALVPGRSLGKYVASGYYGPKWVKTGLSDEVIMKAGAFDFLVGHMDRHVNNAMLSNQGKLYLIDNSDILFHKIMNDPKKPQLGTTNFKMSDFMSDFAGYSKTHLTSMKPLLAWKDKWPSIAFTLKSLKFDDSYMQTGPQFLSTSVKSRFDALMAAATTGAKSDVFYRLVLK